MLQTVFSLRQLRTYVEVFTYFYPILKNFVSIFKAADG